LFEADRDRTVEEEAEEAEIFGEMDEPELEETAEACCVVGLCAWV